MAPQKDSPPPYLAIPNPGTPGILSSQTISFCQAREFYSLALHKNARVKQLQHVFEGSNLDKIFLSYNLKNFACTLPACVTECFEADFSRSLNTISFPSLRRSLAGTLVVINNNDFAKNVQGYCALIADCAETIFAAWDWDNHHWLDLSAPFAANADIYAPAHHENLYLLTRYNWLTVGPVYCASVQWPSVLLTESLPEMIRAQRSNAPLGKHIPYAAFEFRNQVLATLSNTYPSIGFSDPAFHGRSPADRLQEWINHKLHWISPVLNDVPIRIFDALITGGIPIVPESMRHLPPLSSLKDSQILFYSPDDILNPKPLVDHGVQSFDSQGAGGIIERHRYALKKHHGDNAIRAIREMALQKFCNNSHRH